MALHCISQLTQLKHWSLIYKNERAKILKTGLQLTPQDKSDFAVYYNFTAVVQSIMLLYFEQIKKAIDKCTIVLVVIGKSWMCRRGNLVVITLVSRERIRKSSLLNNKSAVATIPAPGLPVEENDYKNYRKSSKRIGSQKEDK